MKRLICGLGLLFLATSIVNAGSKPRYDNRGNWVIADQYNNRIIEWDPVAQTNVWQYEVSISRTATNWLVAPRDVGRFKGETLIVTGSLPPGVSPEYPAGYTDERLFEVDRKGKIRWDYGQTTLLGTGDHDLNQPAAAVYAPRNCILIADQGNHRIIHVQRKGKKRVKIFWQYGTTGVSGSGTNQLNSPASVQRLGNGHYLIADTGNDRVIEVNRNKNLVVWQYGSPGDTMILNAPTYACRLKGDTMLITDSGNNRILVVDRTGSNLFTYVTAAQPGSVGEPQPVHAVPLKNGDILISDQFNHQVIEVNPSGNVVSAAGEIGVSGHDDGLLYAPADAKVVDDFTGLTAPRDSGGGGGFGSPF